MKILHIAALDGDICNGVCVVAPQHIRAQEPLAQVAFINILGVPVPGISCQLDCPEGDVSNCPPPFQQPDLVVFHEVYRPAFLKIAENLVRREIPYIVVPHCSLTRGAQRIKPVKKFVGNLLLFRRFIQRAAGIQFLTQEEKKTSIWNRRGFVAGNGIPLPPEQKTDFHEQEIQFIYIGRTDVYHKGLDLMLKAAAKTAAEWRAANARLALYGPDDGHSGHRTIRKLIRRYGLDDFVTLQGAITGRDKTRALLGADIFIQTSRLEGLPVGILEAMSLGLPCLVTEGTNMGAYIRQYDAGWIAPTDSDSIGEAMIRAMHERNSWKDKSARVRRAAAEQFDWNTIAQKTLCLYRKCTAEKGIAGA